MHYNRHRYYDPESSQYLSSDPIGLAGGFTPQGYVHNPNGWVDPLGLKACEILFGQKRIAETFRDIGSGAPDFIRGRLIKDVADDLANGVIKADQLPVSYFINPKTGQMIAESNRTLAAFAMANVKPTIFNQVEATSKLMSRLAETPIRSAGELFKMPGKAIPVTVGKSNNTIIDIIRLPW